MKIPTDEKKILAEELIEVLKTLLDNKLEYRYLITSDDNHDDIKAVLIGHNEYLTMKYLIDQYIEDYTMQELGKVALARIKADEESGETKYYTAEELRSMIDHWNDDEYLKNAFGFDIEDV